LFEGSLSHVHSPIPLDVEPIQSLIDRTMGLVDAIHAEPGTLVERLMYNAQHDEVLEVRSRNICMLLLHFSNDQDRTHSCLNAILQNNGLPMLDAADEADIEHAWTSALEGAEDVAAASLGALLYVGSARAVPAIRAYASQPNGDFRRRVAERTVATIQDRVRGLQKGGLSLIEGEAGALSVTSQLSGSVTLSESEPD
jgi:hypothetical protein